MDELVKMLRTCAERDSCIGWREACPYLGTGVCDNKAEKAADAIEEMSKQHEAKRENIVVLMDIIENDRKEIEWLKKCVNDLPKPARSKEADTNDS